MPSKCGPPGAHVGHTQIEQPRTVSSVLYVAKISLLLATSNTTLHASIMIVYYPATTYHELFRNLFGPRSRARIPMQAYVALSRCTLCDRLGLLLPKNSNGCTQNIVYQGVYQGVLQ